MKRLFLILLLTVLCGLSLSCKKQSSEQFDPHTVKCRVSLYMIQVAKDQIGVEQGLPNGASITQKQISQILGSQFSYLSCPAGGKYNINPIGNSPACSVHGVLLEDTVEHMILV